VEVEMEVFLDCANGSRSMMEFACMKRVSSYSTSSSPDLFRRSTPSGIAASKDVGAGHDGSGIGTLENPANQGFMVSCWQNGRRVLMHSSEVAKLMKKDSGAPRANATPSPRASAPAKTRSERQFAAENGGALRLSPAAKSPSHVVSDEGKLPAPGFDLSPPPIVPRSRSLAQSEIWQTLAKRMMEKTGQPPRCHKSSCRRRKRCIGGRNACYLRAFAAVDVVMQELLRQQGPALRVKLSEAVDGEATRDASPGSDETALTSSVCRHPAARDRPADDPRSAAARAAFRPDKACRVPRPAAAADLPGCAASGVLPDDLS
jgi:hypothetical protein